MNRKTVSVVVLISLVLGLAVQSLIKAPWRQYPIMVIIICAGIVMFIWSGNDSNWVMEKSLIRLFRRSKWKKN